jgi:hypothetical protein
MMDEVRAQNATLGEYSWPDVIHVPVSSDSPLMLAIRRRQREIEQPISVSAGHDSSMF